MSPRRPALYAFALVLLVLALTPRIGRAQGRSASLHVLEIDSDDSDDQAEGLTGALRSRVRGTPGWTLLETTQSLSMLTAALHCPQRPDPGCLQRIGDQLKTDRFIWGLVAKAPQHQVTAEVHLWIHGKPDQVVKETYSENLKDQNEDALRKIAGLIFERLTGTGGISTLVVTAGTEEGVVFVDGESRGPLDHGHGSFQVPAGSHVVEVRGPNLATRRNVSLAANATTEVSFPVTAASSPEKVKPPAEPSAPLPTRTIAGWSLTGAGVVMLAVGAITGVNYLHIHGQMKDYLQPITQDVPVCPSASPVACQYYEQHKGAAVVNSALFWTFASAGLVATAVGVYLLKTDPGSEKRSPAQSRLRILPNVSPRGGGIDLGATF